MRSRRTLSKRRWKIYLVLVLMLCALVGVVYFTRRSEDGLTSNILEKFSPSATPIPVKTIKHHFVAVTDFKSLKTDYTLEELKRSDLVTISENVDIFPDGFQADVMDLRGVERLCYREKLLF